jgi:hypothetical protein
MPLISARYRNLLETGLLSFCASSAFLALTLTLGIQTGYLQLETKDQKSAREAIGLAPGRIRLDGTAFTLPKANQRNPRRASYSLFREEEKIRETIRARFKDNNKA